MHDQIDPLLQGLTRAVYATFGDLDGLRNYLQQGKTAAVQGGHERQLKTDRALLLELANLLQERRNGAFYLAPIKWRATAIAARYMEKARNENPRGDKYREGEYDVQRLFALFEQNIAELRISLQTGEDTPDKIADCLNYLAFMLDNLTDPPNVCQHRPVFDVVAYTIKCGECGIKMKAVPA